MAYIEPSSTIVLMKNVVLDPNYENTLSWPDLSNYGRDQQEAYFFNNSSVGRYSLPLQSYIRKSRGVIKAEIAMSSAYDINYMAFKNTNFENKWFYAFVTNVEYINNNTCEITYELDFIQTWYFEIKFNQCFIDRQHGETDNIGDNLVEEGLETGEYVNTDYQGYPITPCIVVAVTEVWNSTDSQFEPVAGHSVDGLISAGKYYSGCEFLLYGFTRGEINTLNLVLEKYTEENKQNAIVSIFIAPAEVFVNSGSTVFSPIVQHIKVNDPVSGYIYSLDGYTPKNKKLLQYPYNFMQVSNYQGSAIDFRYEFFDDPDVINFERFGNATLSPGILIYAKNYKGLVNNFEEIVSNQCYPSCCYNIDTFKAWLAQNKGSLFASQVGIAAGFAKGISSAATSGNTTALTGALAGAFAMSAQIYDHSTLPPSQHGDGNGDLMYQAGLGGFGIYHKTITADYARRIDDFFNMYGYKQNKAGIPNLRARPRWTYVKTADCSIEGKMPVDAQRKIEDLFNTGMRFWMLPEYVGNYAADNSPVQQNSGSGSGGSSSDPAPVTPTPTTPTENEGE